ncbi:MAG: NapC/NirT family cytochrome c [bacterium]|nr:NapC/NirT family cytochrome c [bacterium]
MTNNLLKDRMSFQDFLKKRKSHIMILAAALACALFSLWVLNNYILDRPSFCASCHMIKSANDSWQKAKHKPQYTKNSCNACHVEPGLIGPVKASIYGLKNLYTFFFGPGEDDIKASRPVYCTQRGCHERMEKSMFGKKVRVNHGLHMSMGYSCVICHDRVAHEEYAMVSNLSMMRDFCFACHNDEIAPRKECNICHVYQDRMMKGTETADNLTRIVSPHLQPDEVSCQNCHVNLEESAEKSCLNCHDAQILDQYRKDKADFSQRLSQVKAQIDEINNLMVKIGKPTISPTEQTAGWGANKAWSSSGEAAALAQKTKSSPGETAPPTDPLWEQILSLSQIVQKNYTYLIQDNSRGAHNKKLAEAILTKLEADTQKVRYALYNYQGR